MYVIRFILFSFAIFANPSLLLASADHEDLRPGAYFSILCDEIHDEIELSILGKMTIFSDFSLRIAAGKPLLEKELLVNEGADQQKVTHVKSVRLKSGSAVSEYSRCKNKNRVSTIFPMETYEAHESASRCLYEKGFTVYLSGTRSKQDGKPKREVFSSMHLEFPADDIFNEEDNLHIYLRLLKIGINLDTRKPIFEMELEQVKKNGQALWAVVKPKYCIEQFYGICLK